MKLTSGPGSYDNGNMGCATSRDAIQLLNSEVRHDIMLAIARHDQCSGELAVSLDLDGPVISTHTTVLQNCGLLNMTKHGKKHVFSLGPTVKIVRVEDVRMLAIHCRNGQKIMVSLE